MTAPLPSMPPPVSPLKRWGPVVAILAVVALVAGFAVLGGGDDETEAGPTGTGAGGGGSVLPILWHEAEEAGTLDDYEWVANCDEETGKLAMPSVYAPPCQPVFEGDNGGATAPGVTGDTIKVVVYEPQLGNDLLSALQGKTDEPEVAMRTRSAFVEMFTDIYETYGRRVELVVFQATGASDDETAAIADAREVAQDIGAFASLGGPALTGAYAKELASHGVICIGCGVPEPDSAFQENAPYWWGTNPTPEQYLLTIGDYVAGTLLGKPAEFAGSESLRAKERVFGAVHFEQETPVFSGVNEEVKARGADRGYESAITETYTMDFATMPQRAASIIAALKEAGVTTVIFLGDPIMPTYLTKEATAQDYFPEWIVTGTVLTDTSALARLYDQQQWAHAFGVSPLAARTPQENTLSWRLHEWYFGTTPEAANTQQIIFSNVTTLMFGIHAAGPNLNAESFRDGLFRMPPMGGGPTTPQISFGEHGIWEAPDYLATDDLVEIWWDADLEGEDEQGVFGPGMYRYANNGARFLPGEITPRDSVAFDEANTLTVVEELPPEDLTKTYDPPERGALCPPTGCSSKPGGGA